MPLPDESSQASVQALKAIFENSSIGKNDAHSFSSLDTASSPFQRNRVRSSFIAVDSGRVLMENPPRLYGQRTVSMPCSVPEPPPTTPVDGAVLNGTPLAITEVSEEVETEETEAVQEIEMTVDAKPQVKAETPVKHTSTQAVGVFSKTKTKAQAASRGKAVPKSQGKPPTKKSPLSQRHAAEKKPSVKTPQRRPETPHASSVRSVRSHSSLKSSPPSSGRPETGSIGRAFGRSGRPLSSVSATSPNVHHASPSPISQKLKIQASPESR